MEERLTQHINELSEKFNAELEQALIDACMNKGFVLNIASAPDFTHVEFDGWKTLLHMPTNTLICRYSTIPEVLIGYDNKDFVNNEYTVRANIKFQQL